MECDNIPPIIPDIAAATSEIMSGSVARRITSNVTTKEPLTFAKVQIAV